MVVEDKIEDCEYNLKQIKHFNPDPYYVDYFFQKYILCVIAVYEEILLEANRDFGLFISKKCTMESFERKALEKNDKIALNFISWFRRNYHNEHKSPYAKFIKKIIKFTNQKQNLPKISLKILANQRYKDDPVNGIVVGLKNGKLKSIEELQIEVKRQIPVFLEIINQKRKITEQPKVLENQIVVSTFIQEGDLDFEIPETCKIYLPVMKRIIADSRIKIKQLTRINF